MKQLEKVLNYLNNIPHISRGGCGISALAISQWLFIYNQKTDIKFIFAYNWMNSNERKNIAKINNNRLGLDTPSHIQVQVDIDIIDSDGIHDIPVWNDWHYVTKEQLVDCVLNSNDWNSKFDRAYIQNIEEFLKIDLKLKVFQKESIY